MYNSMYKGIKREASVTSEVDEELFFTLEYCGVGSHGKIREKTWHGGNEII